MHCYSIWDECTIIHHQQSLQCKLQGYAVELLRKTYFSQFVYIVHLYFDIHFIFQLIQMLRIVAIKYVVIDTWSPYLEKKLLVWVTHFRHMMKRHLSYFELKPTQMVFFYKREPRKHISFLITQGHSHCLPLF